MASVHKHIRSGTANKRPTTAIAEGQIALATNITSPGLFFKDSTGATIVKIGPVHVGATAPNVSPAGSAGNSIGEVWLDTSLTPIGVKIYNGTAFVNATPIGSTTVQGLLELATDAETQAGADTARAVTSASLQSKLSDSTNTTSNTTIASSTAVKAAFDLAGLALPKTGGTVTGNLEIGTAGSLTFEGATADGFETIIAVVDPTVDRTITLPNITGTVVTTGDTGTVTSTMLLDGTIVDADINASAEISVSKLVDGSARQLLQTDAAGTGVEWASNIDIPGTLDVTSAATFDSTVTIAGDLTVNGTTTNINTVNLTVEDKNVIIGDVATPTDITADGGGITLKGTTDKTINWVDATDAWTLSEHVNIASAKEYRIAGTKVLDATSLGSAVVSSSLTSVGTIGTGVWQGTAIIDTYLATIATAGKVSNSATTAASANTASAIVARDGSGNFTAGTITATLTGNASTVTTNANLTGDVTSTGNATAIAAGVIVNADVNASAAIAGTKIAPDFGAQTITTTGVISPALGTAALPSVAFTGDTNTGIFSPGADQLAISTSGTSRLHITSGGLVGIGTASPKSIFTTQGNIVGLSETTHSLEHYQQASTSFTATSIDSVISGPSGLLVFKTGTNWTNGNAIEAARIRADGMFEVKGAGTAGSSPAFSVNGSAPANSAVLDSSGRLGIGTSSPSARLDVDVAVNIPDTGNPSAGSFITARGNTATVGYGPSFQLLNVSGAKETIWRISAVTANANNGDLVFNGYNGGADYPERLRITAAGNVGIGSTGPQGNLHVADATRANIIIKKTGLATIDNSTLSSSYDNIQLGAGGSFVSYNVETATADTHIGHNFYRHSDGNFKYKYADAVARIKFNTNVGETIFDRAASGSANTNITFLESMRLDSSGRLLVGTSTARRVGVVTAGFEIIGDVDKSAISSSVYSNDSAGPYLSLGKSRGVSDGSYTSVTENDQLGNITFAGADGSTLNSIGASIVAHVDGTPGANDMPGRLVFSTTADGSASPTPRMTISSTGSVSISTVGAKLDLLSSGTSSAWGQGIRIGHDTTYHAAVLVNGESNFDRMHLDFHTSNAAAATLRARLTDRFYCDVTTITAFTSERRYKQNIDVAPLIPVDCWTVARDLPIHTYEYKNNPGSTTYGPIVDEIESIDISLILDTGKEDEEGSVHTYDNGRLQAMYQVALQEALKRIEQLESKVAALEGA